MSTNTALEIYGNKIIEELRYALASIFAFSIDLSPSPLQKGKTIRVPKISGSVAAEFNAVTNNYDAGSVMDMEDIVVTFNKRPLAKHAIDDEQVMNYPAAWWETKGAADAAAVALSVLTDVIGLVTPANFGDAAADKMSLSLAGFTLDNVGEIRAAAVKKKLRPAMATLVLNPDFYSRILSKLDAKTYGDTSAIQDGILRRILGFRQIVECPILEIPGFVCHPDAIGFGNRYLKPKNPNVYSYSAPITEEETGLTIGIREFENPVTGVSSISAECAYGRSVGNEKAVLRLI